MRSTSTVPGRVAVLAITRPGVALAARVAAALPVARLFVPNQWCAQAQAAAPGRVTCYSGGTSAQVSALFAEFTGIVAVLSLGAMVRLIAPHLRDKTHDPAVVVLDEAGRYAIPVLSGHLGGANALATHLAGILDAVPVLTTASDVQETLTVDLLGREFGWTLEASHQALLAASAAVVNHEPVALVQEVGSRHWWSGHANGRTRPLPDNIQVLPRIEDVDPSRIAALLWISQRPVEALPGRLCQAITDRLVVYRPPLEDSV